MTMLSITAAAKAAGVSRTTIYERINDGDLSRAAGGGIDTAELIRVFGELKSDGAESTSNKTATSSDVQLNTAEHAEMNAVENERWLRELVDQQRAEISARNRELQELRQEKNEAVREAEARAERREATWQRQIDMLTGLLPAPAEPEPTPMPKQKRTFFDRVFGYEPTA